MACLLGSMVGPRWPLANSLRYFSRCAGGAHGPISARRRYIAAGGHPVIASMREAGEGEYSRVSQHTCSFRTWQLRRPLQPKSDIPTQPHNTFATCRIRPLRGRKPIYPTGDGRDRLGKPQTYVANVEGLERRLHAIEFLTMAGGPFAPTRCRRSSRCGATFGSRQNRRTR